MSDQGEKTCPLCAEEMDLTDQQLKPCKCGYQICVWCWHHIMDMAEKDNTEGRCPACRTPYDKEKIVGMAANCERLLSEVNTERKKTQKPKSKPSEGRKQLTSVRVIQRNLVYVVGLPLSLADEDLLQHKEHFGQYGKVLKVSMSRTASGVIQQFPNNTCSVYITYSNEEEAIRCIQSVHGFVLDGRSLKACFGTTKYCHAWLRNVPCNNPDCLYLHEIGSQEDSFTKDEIISAYTRSRVQQITGATNNLQRHSGNMLPPPEDGYCSNSSTAKPIAKVTSNNTTGVPKSSPPNESSCRSATLPAAASWGTRASSQQSVVTPVTITGSSDQQRPVSENGILAFSGAVANTSHASVSHIDILKKPPHEEESQILVDKSRSGFGLLKPWQHNIPVDPGSKPTTSPDRDPTSSQRLCSAESAYNSGVVNGPSAVMNPFDHMKEGSAEDDQSVNNLCADVAWMGIASNSRNDLSGASVAIGTISDQDSISEPDNEVSKLSHGEQSRNNPYMNAHGTAVTSLIDISVARPDWNWRMGPQLQAEVSSKSGFQEIISSDSQRYTDAEFMGHGTSLPNSSNFIQSLNHLSFRSSNLRKASGNIAANSDSFLDSRDSDRLLLPNGITKKSMYSTEHLSLSPNEGREKIQKGEDDIISTILSLDFDPWGESLVSPQNLAKILNEADLQATSLKSSNPLNVQHNNQSRFYFAQQDESNNQSLSVEAYSSKDHPTFQDSAVGRDMYLDKFGIRNGFVPSYSEGLHNFSANSVFPSYKIPVSRSQISPPPGFPAPNRSPPPGFSSNGRLDQSFDAASGPHLLDQASFLRNMSHALPPDGNFGVAADIEFMDPAILAVGRGSLQNGLDNADLNMRAGFSPQPNSFENDATLRLLMQKSLSSQQNFGLHDLRDSNYFSSLHDSYGVGSRLMDQTQGTSLSPFTQLSRQLSSNSSGCWDRWNEVQGGNSLGMAELLRNEQLGFSSNLYNGFEESKFWMPGSRDLYNRTYRM